LGPHWQFAGALPDTPKIGQSAATYAYFHPKLGGTVKDFDDENVPGKIRNRKQGDRMGLGQHIRVPAHGAR
jgi:hypothetical protein